MNAFITLAATLLLVTAQAQADGFICTTESGLNVKIFNHTQPSMGTRTGAIMVVSDSSINAGNKTIATFKDLTGTLKSNSLIYTGKVDLRFNDSSRKGELIGGTKLGQLASIQMELGFSYLRPEKHGDFIRGSLDLNKRNGEVISERANCTRYLKN